MAGRRTNLALLVLLPVALLTGFLCFLVGSGPVRLVVAAHGVVGLAILALVPWKSAIARRGLRRRRPGRVASILLAFLVVVALVSGLLHSTGVLVRVGVISAIQVHVGASLVALIPVILHIRRRRVRPRITDLSRRSAMQSGLLAAGSVALYYLLAGTASVLQLPGARRRATGSYPVASGRVTDIPATIWLFDDVPRLDPAAWRLTTAVGGEVQSWTLDQIRAGGDQVTAILDCTNGWWSEQTWSGIRLARLLPPESQGTVTVISATGYRRRLPLTDDLLLAAAVGGSDVSVGHGAPVRLVVPGRRGFHWVKWVVRIEHDDRPWWWQLPVPVQ